MFTTLVIGMSTTAIGVVLIMSGTALGVYLALPKKCDWWNEGCLMSVNKYGTKIN
jgi:hypothetical protein